MKKLIFLLISFLLTSISYSQKVEVKDSINETLITINDEGINKSSITIQNSGSAPGMLTDKLYNVGHSLYWNGSMLSTSGSSVWSLNGSNAYYNTGNVGIGTSSPQNKLHLVGDFRMDDASPYMNFYSGTTQMGNIGFWSDNNLNIINRSATSPIVFATNAAEKMRITADGNVGLGAQTLTAGLHVDKDNGVLFEGAEWFNGNTSPIPKEGAGSRMMWYPKKSAFRAGYSNGVVWDDVNIGNHSIALGFGTRASGSNSTALGDNVIASGFKSIAIGSGTIASGENSTAMGYLTTANAYHSTAIGHLNVGGGNEDSWVDTDPLFEIGNGTNSFEKSNALTVLKNGNVGIGPSTPTHRLEVVGTTTGDNAVGHFVNTSQNQGYAVYGEAVSGGNTTNYGGHFQAGGLTGRGVYGVASNTGDFTNYGGYFEAYGKYGRGVLGTASGESGTGVFGVASNNGDVTNYGGHFTANGRYGRGVYSTALGESGKGVYGYASNNGDVTNYGGYFQANGTSGRGVYGNASGDDGRGVSGQATGTDGRGVYGIAFGESGRGVYGVASNDGDVFNYGGFFQANGTSGTGVSGIAYGETGTGVYGVASNDGDVTNYGGYFAANGTSGRGVYGTTSGASGRGVYGYASNNGAVTNYGGYFGASGDGGVGVFGEASSNSSFSNYGGYFVANGNTGYGVNANASGVLGTGVYGSATGASGIGVFGEASSNGADPNTGGYFQANGTLGRGVYAEAKLYGIEAKSTATSGNVSGGWFEAESDEARAVYGLASATSGTTFGGAFNAASSPNGTGVWASGGQYDFYAGGPGTDYGTSSSKRWKENVVSIGQPLQKITALRGVFFDWDNEHGGQHDIGFIAEEVGEVLPEIVDYEENGIDAIGLDYSKLSPLLVEAVKALVAENELLKAEVKTLKTEAKTMKIEHKVINSRLDQLEAMLNTNIPNK